MFKLKILYEDNKNKRFAIDKKYDGTIIDAVQDIVSEVLNTYVTKVGALPVEEKKVEDKPKDKNKGKDESSNIKR